MPAVDPSFLENDIQALEEIEKETMRLVSEAIYLQLEVASEEFKRAGDSSVGFAGSVTSLAVIPGAGGGAQKKIGDKFDYLGEDLTRMALDGIGFSRVPGARLFGAVDYKAARFLTTPDFSVNQALLIDTKAEKNAYNNCRVQITQTSMTVRQIRQGENISMPGLIDKIWDSPSGRYITTTVFVKYHYVTDPAPLLKRITIACLPHGFLQEVYNPSHEDGIWNVGPDAPSLKEKFRTRLNFRSLEDLASWRVQRMLPGYSWSFDE